MFFRSVRGIFRSKSNLKKKKHFVFLDKRHKFGIGVAISSLGLFIAQFSFSGYGIAIAIFLGIFSDLILFWSIHDDLEGNFSVQAFILPFLYSLSFGLFSLLAPGLLRTRIILTALYAIGLYSVFLSENIFTVAALKTIALLHSARIVSVVISLVTYFFLLSIIFSLRAGIMITEILVAVFSFLISMHAIWSYTLEKSFTKDFAWIFVPSLIPVEFAVTLVFWPSSPVVSALFIVSMWYVFIGLSHVWLDKRLFRNVLWEYIWVAVIGIIILIAFTNWR